MAQRMLIDSRPQSFGELLSNGRTFEVPRFQRDYAWAAQHWEELWDDIQLAVTQDEVHYMGTVVLQHESGKGQVVIDGQQRLATLMLVVLAAVDLLQKFAAAGHDPDANGERARLLSERFVRTKQASSLSYRSRLTLNRNSDGFFQSYLVQLLAPPAPSRLSAPDKALWDASEYFRKKLHERFSAAHDGEAVASFVETDLADRLSFIEVAVPDELHAYTLFETLNARGVELTVTDLLKNHLFALSADSETDLELTEERWRRILTRVPPSQFPAVLRHHWNSAQPYVREQVLFKVVRRSVRTKADAFVLMQALDAVSELHASLSDPSDPFWANDQELIEHVRDLRLFKVSQCNPLIYAAHRHLDRAAFRRVLRACVVLSLRYTVIGRLNPQPLERAYNRAAIEVSSGRATTARQAIAPLRDVYVGDDDFVNMFRTHTVREGSKPELTRYLLAKLEAAQAGQTSGVELNGSIEHILPEHLGPGWIEAVSAEEHAALVYRLGNLTLLERSLNAEAAARPFPDKRGVYARSRFAMTRAIDNETWARDEINQRQARMAAFARTIWQIDFSLE